MVTFLNVHGFGSTGDNTKAAALRNHFPDNELISPDFPMDPFGCMELLEKTINKYADRELVLQGSSMGGFYSLLAHIRFGVKVLMINPALNPSVLLLDHIGEVENYKTGEKGVVTHDHVQVFEKLEDEIMQGKTDPSKLMALLGEEDEVLDQKVMKKILDAKGVNYLCFHDNHHFDAYDILLEEDKRIRSFLVNE
jgi:hypothetical protein